MVRGKTLAAASLGAASLLGACSKKDDASEGRIIEIGLLVDFEDAADTEEDIAKANMAAKEINDAGGIIIDGEVHELRIVAEDHGGSADGGIEAISRLKAQGVTAVIGPPWSSIVLGDEPDGSDGAALAAAENDILCVSTSATSPLISNLDDDDLFFRTAPSDALQAVVAARYLLDEKGVTRAAVLYRDEAWGRGLFQAFSTAFEGGGGEIINSVSYDVSGSEIDDVERHDYTAELTELFQDSPDVVILMNFDEVWQITNRIVQGGYLDEYGDTPPLFFGTDATFTDGLLTNGHPDVLTHMEGTAPLADDESEDYRLFVQNLEEAGLGRPDGFDAARYDGVYTIALAIQSAQSIEAQDFKQHMRVVANADPGDTEIHVGEWAEAQQKLLSGEGINYEGATGPIEFDEKGDPSSAFFVLYRVVDSAGDTFEYDLSNTVLFP